MTEDELRHAVGDRVYDAFAPHGLLYNHDAEDPDNLAFLGTTDKGEEVEINKRAAESDLLVYVNINLVVDGRRLEVARPPASSSYRSLRHHHNVKTMQHSQSFMDRHRSELHSSNWRMGKVLQGRRRQGLPDRDDAQQQRVRHRRARWPCCRSASGSGTPRTASAFLGHEGRARPHAGPRPAHDLPVVARRRTSSPRCRPARSRPCTRSRPRTCYEQHLVPVEGQTDILTMGLPYICPYNVNSIMNPILVMCLGLGYFFNLYRGKPLVREGGVLIMSHPTPWEFHPVHHPSYIDFFEQVLAETTDPLEIEAKYEKQFAEDEWYRHLYRTSYAYHGVHPFYMWYWGAHALQHLGQVIIVGGDAAGRAPARVQAGVDAAGRARDGLRRRRPRRLDHPPAQPADPHGGRDVSAIRPAAADRPRACPSPATARRAGHGRALAAASAARCRSRCGRRPCPAASSRQARAARSAPTTTPTGPAATRPAWPACCVLRGPGAPGHAGAGVARPSTALDRLHDLEGPAIFAANHHSHVDTPLLLSTIPEPWRHQHVRGRGGRLLLRQPGHRAAVGPGHRRHPDRAARRSAASPPTTRPSCIDDGWSMLIFPEGGRSPDGWGQPFRGGAAYLSLRCDVPVVPDPRRGHRPHPAQGHATSRRRRRPRVTFGAPAAARPRARTPAASAPASRPRSPPWPTRTPPTGTQARKRAHAGDVPVARRAPTSSAPGAAPGPSATAAPSAAAPAPTAGPTSPDPPHLVVALPVPRATPLGALEGQVRHGSASGPTSDASRRAEGTGSARFGVP